MSFASTSDIDLRRKWLTLILLAVATVLSMSLWFSATAVNPSLKAHWQLSTSQTAWLTMSVQIGFVVGALVSALLNLADRIAPRIMFLVGILLGAAVNAAIGVLDVSFEVALVLRAMTGMSCAWVYPVGMKIMATWTKQDRGLGLGILVGAVVVGSAAPHLLRALNATGDWRTVMIAASSLALVGGFLASLFAVTGPYRVATPPIQWKRMGQSLVDRPLRLANLGYLGHMWELYAMWTWLPLFLAASIARWQKSTGANQVDAAQIDQQAAMIAFIAIAAGGLGSLVAGLFADRIGRTTVTIFSLMVSGSCSVCIGFTFGSHPLLVTTIAVIWGFAVVADSAQFSSCVSELAEPEYVGTHLTTQTAAGFLLTLTTIQMVPSVLEWGGWRWAFAPLVLGPIVGSIAMWRLRTSEDASRIAGGRR